MSGRRATAKNTRARRHKPGRKVKKVAIVLDTTNARRTRVDRILSEPIRSVMHVARIGVVSTVATFAAQAAWADDVDDLVSALRIDDMIAIMRDEGLGYADELAAEMFMDGARSSWELQVNDIYNAEIMLGQVTHELRAGLSEAGDLSELIDFYSSDLGRNIVALELEARSAMTDPDVEDAALDVYSERDGSDDVEFLAVSEFVEANDLIGMNVSGTLNSMFQFYSGLADGGAIEAGEGELLDQIWAQQDQITEETREWIFAYLLLAYGPLSPEELDTYTSVSTSPAGKRLNAALFAGFNMMYDNVSYSLGRAAAGQMGMQEL